MTIDGNLDEKAWQGLVAATNFKVYKQMKVAPASGQTSFRIGWDKEFLYVGVRCEEANMDKVKSTVPDGGYILAEDSVEIFIASDEIYEHFAVSPIGSRWNRGLCTDWEAAAVRGSDFWSVEAKIPFRELGGAPGYGTRWTVNVFRNATHFESGKRKLTSWSAVRTGAHDAAHFRGIEFADRALDAGEADVNTERFNVAVEQGLLDEVRMNASRVLVKCSEQMADVEERAAGKRFGQELLRLTSVLREKAALDRLDAIRGEAESLHAEIIKHKMAALVASN